METLFIEARYKGKIKLPKKAIDALPKKIGIITTVQHIGQIEDVIKQLESGRKTILEGKGRKTKYKAQVLGCDVSAAENIKDKVEAFLYIGTGLFHPKLVLINTGKQVFCYNPLAKTFREITKDEVADILKMRKAAIARFHTSGNIGIIVSTKPGQNRLQDAIELKKKLKNKKCYIFLAGTIDFNDMENFNFIDCWINTACPRIGYDDLIRTEKPIVNINDIK